MALVAFVGCFEAWDGGGDARKRFIPVIATMTILDGLRNSWMVFWISRYQGSQKGSRCDGDVKAGWVWICWLLLFF